MVTNNQAKTVPSAPVREATPPVQEARKPDTIESKNGLKALETAESMMKDGTPFVMRTSDGETHTVRVINVRRNNEDEERGVIIIGYKQNGELKVDKMPVRKFAEGLNIGPEIVTTVEREQKAEQQEKAAELDAKLEAMKKEQATLSGKLTTAAKLMQGAASRLFGQVDIFLGGEPKVDLIEESGFPLPGSSKGFKRMHEVSKFLAQDSFELMMAKNVRAAFEIKAKLPAVSAEAETLKGTEATIKAAKVTFNESTAAAADALAAMVLGRKSARLAEVKNPDPEAVKDIEALKTGLAELKVVEDEVKANA